MKKQRKSAWIANMAAHSSTEEMPVDGGSNTRNVLKAISALRGCAEIDIWSVLTTLENSGTWLYIETGPNAPLNFEKDWTP